jgi:predicted nucleotidyltransferase
VYGLSAKTQHQLKKIFQSFQNIEKVILFGSRAKGDFKEGSDIDFAIVGKNIDLDLLLEIKIKIDELDLVYMIDLVDYESIENAALKEHIDRVGKVFFKRPEARF